MIGPTVRRDGLGARLRPGGPAPRCGDFRDLAQALTVNRHLPGGTDTGGPNLEQSPKIVSGPLPERDGTG